MPEITALIESVNQLNRNYEEANDELCKLRADIKRDYIPRKEVDERAAGIRRWLGGLLVAGVIVAASGTTGWIINHRDATKSLMNCEETRQGLRDVIEIALADRKPLPSATPEAAAAIEADNIHRLRPLKERLLQLNGTNPDLCR